MPSGSGSAPEGLLPRRETALSEPEALLSRRLGRRQRGIKRPEDDTLPDRFFQPMEGGILKGKKIGKEQFSKAIETYYEMMSWDPETGIQKKAKLAELDLDWLT